MSSSQVKRYYRHSSGQKRAFDKHNMYQPSITSRSVGKPISKRKQQRLQKKSERKRITNQKHLAAAINEHSIYRDHHNLGSIFAYAYQKAIENKKGEK